MSAVWTNWAGEQRCAPATIVRPGTEAELIEAVRRAVDAGRNVRAVGSGHSFTDCACTDGAMIDMTLLRRLVEVDAGTGRVTVEGGITLRELGPRLAAHGLALENQGDIDAQTITGATATATHGTGARFANISAQVVAMRLVTATGAVLELSTDGDHEAYLAARVATGALGVVSEVTLQTVPLYTLHRRDEPRPLCETLERLDEHVDSSDHFELFVFPYTRTALTRTSHRSAEPAKPTPAWRRRLNEDLLANTALALACRTGRAAPAAVPRINRMLAAAIGSDQVTDRAHRVYASERRVRFTEMEYAIPRAHAAAAVRRVLDAIERRRLPIGFPLEVRFGAGDDALLSTAHGRETCYLAVHQYRGMEFETCFRAVEAIMDEYAGRPHWGKRHYQTAATLRGRYPGWDRFQAVRARLDPGETFANDYTRRTLGPVGAEVAA